jgi:hypothetical protein
MPSKLNVQFTARQSARLDDQAVADWRPGTKGGAGDD